MGPVVLCGRIYKAQEELWLVGRVFLPVCQGGGGYFGLWVLLLTQSHSAWSNAGWCRIRNLPLSLVGPACGSRCAVVCQGLGACLFRSPLNGDMRAPPWFSCASIPRPNLCALLSPIWTKRTSWVCVCVCVCVCVWFAFILNGFYLFIRFLSWA